MQAYLLREIPAEPGKEPALLVADKAHIGEEKKAAPAKEAPKKEAPVDAAKDPKADVAKPVDAKADAAKPADAKADAAKPADAGKADIAKTEVAKDKDGKEIQQPAAEAAPTIPEPAKTLQVMTETWSYQLPADE